MKNEVVEKNHRPLIKELFFEFYEDINTVWSIDLPIKVQSKITLYFFKCLFSLCCIIPVYQKRNQNFITSNQCKDEQYFDDVNPDSKQSRISAEIAIII